ncbi:MAG TPA: FtsX-like permease family protein [Streptosporangiaceae bacterium]|nr:FtsX-like permease family protein [Streptosporangiaceae bacterium]
MNAGWLRLQAELRRRWRSWLALALIVGAFAGAVEAAAAGARRTDAAYPSLIAWSRAPDLLAASGPDRSVFGSIPQAALARFPQTVSDAPVAEYAVVQPSDIALLAPENRTIPHAYWRRKILAGRLPGPRRANEVDVSFTLAQARHVRVGDVLRVHVLTTGASPRPALFAFRVVGIDAAPAEFPPQTGTGTDFVWATPAFYARHHSGLEIYPGVALWLRRGAADIPPVLREINQLTHGRPPLIYPLATQSANTERSIHLQAVALWLLALLLGLIGVLVIGQLLARQSSLEADDFGTLRALGMSPRQLLATGLARAAAIGAGGAVAATVLAVAISPLFPVGLAAIAEPYPGIEADAVVGCLGAVVTVLATVACAAPAAWRAAAVPALTGSPAGAGGTPRRPAAAAVTGGIGRVSVLLGIRLAIQPGAGRTAVPVRSTIASAVVGVAALTAAIVFSASLGHLLATPRLYGVTWDADVQNVNQTGIMPVVGTVARDPQVAGWATAYAGAPLQVDGWRADAIAISPGHGGSFLPAPTRGHLPQRWDEIALGARTLAAIRSHVGATVTVSLAGFRPARLKVVGTAVFPTLSDRLGLGYGSTMTVGGLRHLLPRGVPFPPFDTLLVRFRPRAGVQTGLDALAGRVSPDGPYSVSGPATPTDLVNFGQVQDLPFLLGIALGLLALVTIAHLLLTAVRRRRRDFAILRVIGLTRAQVRATVGWQAATLAGAALVIGIPAGVLLGRAAWRIFAGQLGILPVVTVPGPALAAMTGIALAVAVAAAALPGESAARTAPATILRFE